MCKGRRHKLAGQSDVLRTTMMSFGILKGNFLKLIRSYLDYAPTTARTNVVSSKEGWDKTNLSAITPLNAARYRTTFTQQYFMRKISGSALTLGLLDAVAARYTEGAGQFGAGVGLSDNGIFNSRYSNLVNNNIHARSGIFKV